MYFLCFRVLNDIRRFWGLGLFTEFGSVKWVGVSFFEKNSVFFLFFTESLSLMSVSFFILFFIFGIIFSIEEKGVSSFV